VLACKDPLVEALLENYRVSARCAQWLKGKINPEVESSVLFDTVTVYLAFSEALLSIESLGVRATDDGYTVLDGGARRIRCATNWLDLEAFERLLATRITSGVALASP
jgi:hypothetical protein